jgi:Undecaprenyl-phosphate glucose phosphotransferase
MPGIAEREIAIDVVAAAAKMSAVPASQATVFIPRPRLMRRVAGLIGLDAGVAAAVALLCFGLFHPFVETTSLPVLLTVAWLTLCMSVCFAERGLYSTSEMVVRGTNWRKLALAWLQAVAVGAFLTFCLAAVAGAGLPRGMAGALRGPWLPVLLAAGYAALCLARLLYNRIRPAPAPLNRTVIIGEQEAMSDLVLRIRTAGRHGFDVIGIFEHEESREAQASLSPRPGFLGIPLLGGLPALEAMIRRDAVDTVLVALPWTAEAQMRAVIQRVSMAPVDVYVYPGMKALPHRPTPGARRASSVLQLPLMMACARPIDGWGSVIKRAEDIALALGLLIFISPVMLTIAVLIKLTSSGPVFFRQTRLGYNNRVIEILKFRSMHAHHADADARQQTIRGDKRVTKLGVWLRRFSLDELPQLLNVLKGDMSLVGPRPHALATTAGGMPLDEAMPDYASRHRVKPGITGWAQVNGHRGVLDSVDKIVDRVNHDLYYIENWSLTLDLKILCLTIALIFADDNAF